MAHRKKAYYGSVMFRSGEGLSVDNQTWLCYPIIELMPVSYFKMAFSYSNNAHNRGGTIFGEEEKVLNFSSNNYHDSLKETFNDQE